MRHFHMTSRGLTIIEMTISMGIGVIVMLIGLTTWELGWRGVRDMMYANEAYQDAFGVMNSIQEQVQRSYTIQVPDPDNTGVPSIQLLIPNPHSETNGTTATNPLRRAYRLVGNNLIMQWKDEGNASQTIYTDVTAFSATIQNSPTNSEVQLTCTCKDGAETVSMTTVAWMRNSTDTAPY